MELRKLIVQSLSEAMLAMDIGETAIAPDGVTPKYVRSTASYLKRQGYLFQTSRASGTQTITRLK